MVDKANPKYLSVNWEASGGGAFAVIPISEKGRLPEQPPLFRGHTAVVLDTDWYVRKIRKSQNALMSKLGIHSMISSLPQAQTTERYLCIFRRDDTSL